MKIRYLVYVGFIFSTFFTAPSFADGLGKEVSAGYLKGFELSSGDAQPLLLIIPGSGPTDRDGNTPLGKSRIYQLLADGIFASYRIASVRVDKRGMFSSSAPGVNPNAVTMQNYADDTRLWINTLRKIERADCIWLLGHSEGGLTALLTARQPEGICGLVLVATPGRKIGDLLREQLRNNPANAPLLAEALAAIDRLEKGQKVDAKKLSPALYGLFSPAVQDFLIDQMRYDPPELISRVSVPVLILQGDADIQVSPERDAKRLHQVAPQSRLVVLSGVSHTLKQTASSSLQDNYATYTDPSVPVAEGVIRAIGDFIKSHHVDSQQNKNN